MRPSDPIVDIADQYRAKFRKTLGPVRRIGREAEFPVVWPDGRGADVSLLWAPLLRQGGLEPVHEDDGLLIGARGRDVAYQAEVGKATIELSLGPYDDLWELQHGLNRALDRATAERYARAGGAVHFHGKPHKPIYDASLALLGLDAGAPILAIGDSFGTDIAGANAAGIDSLMITSGIHADKLGIEAFELPGPGRLAALAAQYGARPTAAAAAFRW